MIDLDALTRSAAEIGPLQATASRIAALAAREDWERKELEEIVGFDAPLALHVLRLANSAAYGGRSEIVKVADAAVRLGVSKVLALAMGLSVRGKMDRALPGYRLAQGDLWKHSVAASLVPECLVATCGVRPPEGAETAALLHDVGKLVVHRFLEPAVLDDLSRACATHGEMYSAERDVLGTDHAEVGALVAQHWKLPYAIVEPILYHHRPTQQRGPGCDVVHLANVVAKTCDPAAEAGEDLARLDPGVRERLQISDERFHDLCETVRSRVDEVLARYV